MFLPAICICNESDPCLMWKSVSAWPIINLHGFLPVVTLALTAPCTDWPRSFSAEAAVSQLQCALGIRKFGDLSR